MSKYFTVSHTYVRKLKWEFCTDACTFVSQIFLNEYLTKAQERVKSRMSELKRM
jgi:hypothetical protein